MLYGHIRQHLPYIVKEIQVKAKETEEALDELGPGLPVTENEK